MIVGHAPVVAEEAPWAEVISALPPCPPARRTCIALDVWLAETQAGKLGWVRDQLEAANRKLAVLDVGVEVTAAHRLGTDELDVTTRQARDRLGRHGQQVPLRWFVVGRLVDNLDRSKLRRGVTWRRGSDFYVVESTDAWKPVLAHELGHVLGLPHSGEAASLMNKSVRLWPPFWTWGFTARERPRMRSTLARLLSERRLANLRHRSDR